MRKKLRIAIIGTRGVPANFGGSETAVEEIGARLVQRGHEVTVYCRKHRDNLPGEAYYRGMRRAVLPSINSLNLDLLSHGFLTMLHMWREQFDVAHFHGVGNSLLLPLFKVTGKAARSLVIVDGPDWKRPKWGRTARLALRVSFPMAVWLADEIISDNYQAQEFFEKKYNRVTPLVGYGADLEKPSARRALDKHGVEPGNYILQVAALVPDKGVHVLIEAYEKLETNMPLIIVGDTPYMTEYKTQLQCTKDPRIHFLGYVYGVEYRELLANCCLYIHPLLVDGTSPALLQAMAYGCCIIGSDLPETSWTLADTGPRFTPGDADELRDKMAEMLAHPSRAKEYGQEALRRVRDHFNWDRVTDEYERISEELVERT
jgi:glycosyltransferase involved in cell wall biosynthesis